MYKWMIFQHLYSGALFTVYISLYEGFGFPVLESMACGTPVITTRGSSMQEIVGDAGVLVDPCNTDEIATSMELLIKKPDIRLKFVEKSLRRAKEFSWRSTAEKTMSLYENLYRLS